MPEGVELKRHSRGPRSQALALSDPELIHVQKNFLGRAPAKLACARLMKLLEFCAHSFSKPHFPAATFDFHGQGLSERRCLDQRLILAAAAGRWPCTISAAVSNSCLSMEYFVSDPPIDTCHCWSDFICSSSSRLHARQWWKPFTKGRKGCWQFSVQRSFNGLPSEGANPLNKVGRPFHAAILIVIVIVFVP